jgi:hypothetical protein
LAVIVLVLRDALPGCDGGVAAVIDPTALYYTFSAIAQALAGAFGVLAAFAVLVLTRIEADISAARDGVCEVLVRRVPVARSVGLEPTAQ